jgi:hypothetical protein
MPTQRIQFSEWLPDQPGITGALTDAKNCVSQAVGYGPFPQSVEFSEAASENLTSLFASKQPDGVTKLFAAGRTKIYTVSGVGVLTEENSGYTTAATERFRFTQFGDTIIATNNSEKLQSWVLGSSSAFADLDAAAPVAKYITVVRDFVVVANTYESAAQQQYRVRWSGFNDETDWTPSSTNQSDFQDIADGGQIMGIRGGEFGLVLLERSIHRMSYVGTPFIFQFDNISRNKGCMVSGSIAQLQGVTFFLSDDGFYMCDGQQVLPIGSEKVDRWFLDDVSEADYATMSAAVDPVRKLVLWNYKSKDGSRKLIVYNFSTKKWTYTDAGTDYISDASTASSTLEELDTLSASIDALDTPLDSILFAGGKYFLGGTYATKVMTYTGTPMTARIETGDIEAGGQSLVTLARPQVDQGSATVAVASRRLLSENVTFNTASAADSDNRVSLRGSGKYHRIQVNPTGDRWKSAVAVDIDIVGSGVR